MRTALVQITSSDDPKQNLLMLREMISTAAKGGVDVICTPEVSNCLSTSRVHQQAVLQEEESDFTLA